MLAPDLRPKRSHGFLGHAGTAGELIRTRNWSDTPLGPIESWPSNLQCTLGIMLNSLQPMMLWWGPSLVQLYNDAYLPSLDRAQQRLAMGASGREFWADLWPHIGPRVEAVMTRAEPCAAQDALITMVRNGVQEDVYWSYGYSPVLAEDGQVSGTLVICTETTERVVAERREHTLRSFALSMARVTRVSDVVPRALSIAELGGEDVPFALGYAHDGAEGWRLVAYSNLSTATCARLDPTLCSQLQRAPGDYAGRTLLVELGPVDLTMSRWSDLPTHAVLVRSSRGDGPAFVFGVSPRRPFDAAYARFCVQLVDQVDATLGHIEYQRAQVSMESGRRSLLLQAPVGTSVLVGPSHVYVLANDLYRQAVGGREVLGKAYLDAFPEIAGTELARVLDDVYRNGTSFVAEEYRVPLDRRGDGVVEDWYYRFNLEPLRDEDGTVYGLMCVAVDITEQVRSRIVLEHATEERERLMRTLQAASLAKDEFLTTVSHELRTPLTAILGWVRLLSEGASEAEFERGLKVVERNAKAQARMVDDVLDMSRINAGKLTVRMTRFSPESAVKGAVQTMAALAERKNVDLVVRYADGLGRIEADKGRLQQIVWHLLSNALKFTPRGGRVDVDVTRDSEQLSIRVRDTGKGIAPAVLPILFDPFRQGDSSSTKQYAGLGLGLAIVRHLVELHGGTIRAESPGEDAGATFEVRLPLRSAQPAHTEPPPPRPDFERIPRHARLLGLSVLVVDDNEDARDALAILLQNAGAEVTQAESAAVAMEALARTRFAVLVFDIYMPGEDGYALLARLRASPHDFPSRDVPALALTAYARPEDSQQALEAGFQQHLAKPVDPPHLIDVVAQLARTAIP